MPFVVAAIGAVATAVGSVVAGISVLTGISAGLLSNVVLGGLLFGANALAKSVLGGKKRTDPSRSMLDRLNASIDLRTTRKTVVGHTCFATDIRDEELTGTDQDLLHRFIVLASHEVHSIDEVWFDDKKVWVSGSDMGIGDYANDWLRVNEFTVGSESTAMNISGRMPTDSRRYTGLAWIHFRYRCAPADESPFGSSVPTRITVRGKGALFYDPRKDSTVAGGSGAHRADDQTTWEWDDDACRNPALALLFYLLGWRIQNPVTSEWMLVVGKGIPKERINLESFAIAANICDEECDTEAGGTEPRYRCDGTWSEGDAPQTVIDQITATMNADLDDVDGQLRLTVFHNDLSDVAADFTAADILDEFEWEPDLALDESSNIVRGVYTDPSDASLYQPADYPQIEADSPDGIDRIDTFNIPMVQSPDQAQRLARLRLARDLYGSGTFKANFQATAWKVQKNSIVRLTFPKRNFVEKLFRVAEMDLRVDGVVPLLLREESPSIYDPPELFPAVDPIDAYPRDPLNDPVILALIAASSATMVTLYKRTTTPAAPAVPSADVTFDFATGLATGITNGWTQTVPSIAAGPYLWTIQYPASSNTTGIVDIATGDWSSPALQNSDGYEVYLTKSMIVLPVNGSNAVTDYSLATFGFVIRDPSGTDISSNFALSTTSNPQTLTIGYAGQTGSITAGFDPGENTASAVITATGAGAYSGKSYSRTVTLSKAVANTNVSNDRIATAVVAPTIVGTGAAVDHTVNTDGAANISFEWVWGGTETDIDGFEIIVRQSTSSSAYTLGTTAAEEQVFIVPANKRAFLIYGVPADQYYTFYVRAYRVVDTDIDASGIMRSTAVKPALAAENPYQPASSVAFAGNLTGTINGTAVATVTTAITNFNANNDRNGTTPTNPVVVGTGAAVDHVINTDGSADISFEWTYTPSATPGNAANIDGFVVTVYSSTSASAYTFGATPAEETKSYHPSTERSAVLRGVPADKYYTFFVQAYRVVDTDINSAGALFSTAVKSTLAAENPYRPSANVAYSGDVSGTINGTAAATVTTAITNFNSNNDRNGTTPTAPTIPAAGAAIDHVINTDSSADISFEWNYTPSSTPSAAANIDGYIVTVYSGTGSGAYTFGTTPAEEKKYYLPAAQKALIIQGVPANKYYTFGVQAYRWVDTDINSAGFLASAIIKSAVAGENPYQPSSSVAFAGDIIGTVNGMTAATVVSGATAANAGLDASGNVKTNKVAYSAIILGSVTSHLTMKKGSNTVGNGSHQSVVSGSFTLADDGEVFIQFNAGQTYSSTANWDVQIYIDGVLTLSRGGSATLDAPTVFWAGTLTAGSHSVEIKWYGSNSTITLNNDVTYVQGNMR